MKSKIFLVFYFLISNTSSAQYGYHHYFPLTGKIKSYETFQIIENDLKERQILVEKLTYDNNNRVLSKSTNELLYQTPQQEKNIYKENLIITYECRCEDINEFITNFAVKDKFELKNKKSSGYGSMREPTKFVTYHYCDKKGNITLSEKFGESGYKISKEKTLYNSANKIINKKVFDSEENQTDEYTYEYDKRGNLIKDTSKDLKYSVNYTHVYKYDSANFQNEQITYGNDNELLSHDTYAKVVNENKEEIYKTDNLKHLKSLYKETFFNSKKIVIQTKEYSTYDSIIESKEKKYTEDGILSNINYVDHISASNVKFEQVLDHQKNWIELIVYVSYPNQKEKKEKRIKYIRNIEYIK